MTVHRSVCLLTEDNVTPTTFRTSEILTVGTLKNYLLISGLFFFFRPKPNVKKRGDVFHFKDVCEFNVNIFML